MADGGLFGGLPPPASKDTQEQKAQKLAKLQESIQQQLQAAMASAQQPGTGDRQAAEEQQGAAKRPRLDLDSALVGPKAASAVQLPRSAGGRQAGLFGDLPPARESGAPRGSPLADGKSPWLGTPWIGGKSPWGPRSTEPGDGAVSPGPHGVDTSGSMIGLAAAPSQGATPAATIALRRVRLRKSASGFGLNVSASATVLSFNAEPDGSEGPAAAAGVQKGERIVEVNGVSVADKTGLLAELKKLKAKGVETLEFGLLPPPAAKPPVPAASAQRNGGSNGGGAAAATADAGAAADGWGEFGEDKDDHFVLGPGVSTLREGRYTQLKPLGKGTFSRVIGAVDQGPPAVTGDSNDSNAAAAAGTAGGGEKMKVAIKCLRRAEHVCATGRHELRTLQLVSQGSSGSSSGSKSSLQACTAQAMQSETHCVHLIDHFSTADGHMMLVFPRQDQNLRMVLQASPPPGGIALSQVRDYGRQCLCALRYLCKLNLVHNDIKLDNFLLTEKKSRWNNAVRKSTVLLCDFGNASKPQPAVETRKLCYLLSQILTFDF